MLDVNLAGTDMKCVVFTLDNIFGIEEWEIQPLSLRQPASVNV